LAGIPFTRRLAILFVAVGALVLAPLALAPPAAAAEKNQLRLIRDTEVENIIRAYAAPVFQTTGLDPSTIKVHLVNDSRLNAFVAGGLHMFINTGLLIRSESASQVIGVIAHETGHIAGGHLVRLRQSVKDAQVKSILTFLLGAAAGILAQDSGAAIAVMALGAKATEGALLKFSRTQENAADQFAVSALDDAGISSRGYMEFMRILQGQEYLSAERQDPYQRTHPITSSRVDFVRNHIAGSRFSDAELPPKFAVMHARMRAKLAGFLDYPVSVLARYDSKDPGIEARYARAIALYKNSQVPRAITQIDRLIADYPSDPYFQELKGQVLFENGKIAPSVAAYRKSVRLLPKAPLLRAALGQALLEMNQDGATAEALIHLKEAVRRDADNPMSWRFLGVAYGRKGDIGMASLALSESGVLMGDIPLVRGQVKRAEKHLRRGTPAWQRVQDIKILLAEADRRQRDY
jgi:predicted Zn-dependent protease